MSTPDTARVAAPPDPDRHAWTAPGPQEVVPDVYRIPLPMASDGLRAVNVYALISPVGITLVDAGWSVPGAIDALDSALGELGAGVGDVTDMLVTHAHRDHYTLAVDIRRRGRGASIRIGAGERTSMLELAERQPYATPHQVPILRAAGAPDSVLKAIEEIDFPFDRSEWELPDAWLRDDEVIMLPRWGTLRAIHTPGHTSGHMVFLDEARHLLFGGDHVLPHITPSIGYEQVPSAQPLRAFLQSLDRLASLPDAELLPGHGPTGMSVHARVAELIRHHEQRLEEVLRAVEAGAASAREVAERLRWTRRGRHLDELNPFNQALAMVETIAHLDLLVLHGSLSVDKTTAVQRYSHSS
jgi:glyoxylase-like metal-dependent hydrolase (beta-lactamase superfamily II)